MLFVKLIGVLTGANKYFRLIKKVKGIYSTTK